MLFKGRCEGQCGLEKYVTLWGTKASVKIGRPWTLGPFLSSSVGNNASILKHDITALGEDDSSALKVISI